MGSAPVTEFIYLYPASAPSRAGSSTIEITKLEDLHDECVKPSSKRIDFSSANMYQQVIWA
jgi:hypothetical protein